MLLFQALLRRPSTRKMRCWRGEGARALNPQLLTHNLNSVLVEWSSRQTEFHLEFISLKCNLFGLNSPNIISLFPMLAAIFIAFLSTFTSSWPTYPWLLLFFVSADLVPTASSVHVAFIIIPLLGRFCPCMARAAQCLH